MIGSRRTDRSNRQLRKITRFAHHEVLRKTPILRLNAQHSASVGGAHYNGGGSLEVRS